MNKSDLKKYDYTIYMDMENLKKYDYTIYMDMEKKDLKKLTKGQFIKLLMNQ